MSNILVIDDDEEFGKFLQRCLGSLGFKTIAVPTGAQGVKLAGESCPDLIILDWVLRRGMSSEDVLRNLKSDPATHPIPVVMMSGIKESPDDAEQARRFGAELFLTKPEISENPLALPRHIKCLLATSQQPSHHKILVIDDDHGFHEFTRFALGGENHKLYFADTGRNGLHLAQKLQPTLIILDLTLMDLNGIEVYKLLLSDEKTKHIPVLVVTKLDDAAELLKSAAASLGMEDCLYKPFTKKELLTCIDRILSKRPPLPPAPLKQEEYILERGRIRVDVHSRKVWVRQHSKYIGPRRFALLCVLLKHLGTVSREALLQEVWQDESDLNTVDRTIQRLRKDLDLKDQDPIVAVPGGYQLLG